jgi:hypothetical protein
MNAHRLPHFVNGLLLLLLFGGSLWVYPALPEQIPTAIKPGTVHYADKTVLHWLTGSLFALGMTAFLYAITLSEAMTVPLSPHVNFGNRDTYEQLSTPHKQVIARLLRTGMYWTCTLFLLIFMRGQIEFYIIAMRSADESIFGWYWGAAEFGLVLLFALMFFGWWVPRRIEHLAEVE